MFSVSSFLFNKFGGSGYIPVIRNKNVEDIAKEGIFSIKVENRESNFGYERLVGVVEKVESNSRIIVRTTGNVNFNRSPNIYARRTLYVKPNENSQVVSSEIYRIRSSGELNNQNFIELQDTIGNLEIGSTFEILPSIEITGTGTGAVAIPIFNTENNQIISVRILNSGNGYQNATVKVVNPSDNFDPNNVNRTDVECILRAIISPRGGLGSNPIQELKSSRISIAVNITSKDVSNVADSNTYSKIGLVKNPIFVESAPDTTFDNRLKLVMSEPILGLNVGEEVSQINGVSAKIHEIKDNIIYIVDYNGPYSAEFDANANLITGIGTFNINTIDKSQYIARSGTVLFISDFDPVERSDEKAEQIKLIIDF